MKYWPRNRSDDSYSTRQRSLGGVQRGSRAGEAGKPGRGWPFVYTVRRDCGVVVDPLDQCVASSRVMKYRQTVERGLWRVKSKLACDSVWIAARALRCDLELDARDVPMQAPTAHRAKGSVSIVFVGAPSPRCLSSDASYLYFFAKLCAIDRCIFTTLSVSAAKALIAALSPSLAYPRIKISASLCAATCWVT